jgi:hypothetical protein
MHAPKSSAVAFFKRLPGLFGSSSGHYRIDPHLLAPNVKRNVGEHISSIKKTVATRVSLSQPVRSPKDLPFCQKAALTPILHSPILAT